MIRVFTAILLFSSLSYGASPVRVDCNQLTLSTPARVLTDGEFFNDEESGFSYRGRIDGGEKIYLGSIDAWGTTEEVTGVHFLYVNGFNVIENSRGLGIGTILYTEKLRRTEENLGAPVDQIRASSMTGTNRDTWLTRLAELLKGQPGFVAPASGLNAEETFRSCCSTIFKQYPDLMAKALENTPSFKIRKQLGYGKVCPGSVKFEILGDGQYALNFDSCK